MAARFEERTAGREPSGRFGVDVAEYNRTYVLYDQAADGTDHPIRTQDVTNWITRVTGTTRPGPSSAPLGSPGGAGSVDRVMPMADPQFPSLFADVPAVRIVQFESYVQDQYGGGLLAVPPTQGFARFNAAEFDVPFQARPYVLIPNSRMNAQRLDFYAENGSRRRLTYYEEWRRYVQPLWHAIDSRVSASVGFAMVFRAPSAAGGTPDGDTYTAVPDVLLNDMGLKLRWFQVPLRYLTSDNSYLTRYRGYINQFPFLGKVRGSLLYAGVDVLKTYTPPQFLPANTADPFLQGTFEQAVLADLELSFIFTARRRYAPESGPGDLTNDPDAIPNAERPNNNWVDGPHNWLLHWASKRFHYAHAKTTVANDYAKWVPTYLSVPFELLWQDPDVVGVVVNL